MMDDSGRSPLVYAAAYRYHELLLKSGAIADAIDHGEEQRCFMLHIIHYLNQSRFY